MSARQFHQDGTVPDGVWVFVFGSNLLGLHGGGAARVAFERYGAEYGVTEGRAGNAYAIPTLGRKREQLSLPRIHEAVGIFLQHARSAPHESFHVTRIGCGIAGFDDMEIAPMFADAPANCSFAEEWRHWIEANVREGLTK